MGCSNLCGRLFADVYLEIIKSQRTYMDKAFFDRLTDKKSDTVADIKCVGEE
jgi:hypothetical protein